jgi:hypothetical protein
MSAALLNKRERGEVEAVLAGLRELAGRTSIPLIRACLESAHDDIAYLDGTGPGCVWAGADLEESAARGE